jgi:hypothetical protein
MEQLAATRATQRPRMLTTIETDGTVETPVSVAVDGTEIFLPYKRGWRRREPRLFTQHATQRKGPALQGFVDRQTRTRTSGFCFSRTWHLPSGRPAEVLQTLAEPADREREARAHARRRPSRSTAWHSARTTWRARQCGPSWIGRAAEKPGTQVIVRSQACDVAVGLGALRALVRGVPRRRAPSALRPRRPARLDRRRTPSPTARTSPRGSCATGCPGAARNWHWASPPHRLQ